MTNKQEDRFLGSLHDCYYTTDPRVNKELAKSLKGKNVIVAGAGRGIGRSCAELLAYCSPKTLSLVALEQDEVDETAEICKKANPEIQIKTATFDVQDWKSVKQFLTEVHQEFGGVDILHMNAGRPPQWLTTAEGDPDIWWETVGVSLRGAYNFSRYALPDMQKRREGRIIFTASAGAHANRGMSSYIAGKLAEVRLAEIIHVENFKEHNIKAFAIHPGSTPTRFFHDFKDAVEGHTKDRSWVVSGVEGEEKSAQTAFNFLKDNANDSTYMAAGLVCAIASGQLDFLSGRYVDSSVSVEQYQEQKDAILKEDLYRVRLRAPGGRYIPALDF